jgi:four helix bundle protein
MIMLNKESQSTMVRSHEDLQVYQIAYRLSLEIHKASLGLPKHEQYGLGQQIRSASKSVCANLAEGFGKQRYSKAEYVRFIAIAIGSADEMQVWVSYLVDLGYVSEDQGLSWRNQYKEIAKMLVKLWQFWSRV